MNAMFQIFKSKLYRTDIGASMVEYSLLVVLIAIVAFVAVQVFGESLSGSYDDIASELIKAGQS